ncbi:MAG: regulator of chromosome condensation [Frankiales bacterium]|nr:regulator of chromosome condensation [Frankiales bacterium]
MTQQTRRTLRRWVAAGSAAVLCGAVLVGQQASADSNEGISPASAAVQGHIAAGGLHSCAVLTGGPVQCWGSNDQGQLGNGTVTTSTVPSTVPGVAGAVAVTAGNTHSCALIAGGTVQCWGLDANGQLGDGTTGDPLLLQQRRSPVTVSGVTSATAITAGGFHSCAIVAGGAVVCWGDDGAGQLGDGRPGDKSLSATLVPGLSAVTALSAGEFDTCALLAGGTVRCWGHNGFGQLGDGTRIDRSAPVPVQGLPDPNTNPVMAITTGYGHSCALTQDNKARCWGENDVGQLGFSTAKVDGVMQPSLAPKVVQHNTAAPPLPEVLVDEVGIVALSAGESHNCIDLASGAVRCWGSGGRGQLGTDPDPVHHGIGDSTTTVDVDGLGGAAAAVTAGGFHTCAIVGSGVRCWGYDFYGQLGSSAPGSLVPVQVTAVTGAKVVSAGNGFACALVEAATPSKPVCWGDNSSGQLGAGLAAGRTTVRTPVLGFDSAAALDAGNGHACALPVGSGAPRCWGSNGDGQLGNGTTTSSTTPVTVTALTDASALSSGGALGSVERGHTCAVSVDTRVRCWGRNGNGQLGVEDADHTTSDSSTPALVQRDADLAPAEPGDPHVSLVDLSNVTGVVTGGLHSCALRTDTTVWCWGSGAAGQLGTGEVADSHHAVHVQKDGADLAADHPLTGVTALTAGAAHTCARVVDGTMTCWGSNDRGQLGDGTTTSRSLPALVVGIGGPGAGAQVMTAGDSHTCARLENGALGCWGANGDGQLGDGTVSDALTPHAVSGLGPTDGDVPSEALPVVRSISASRHNTCAVLVDTTVLCWGSNAHDQLGDGVGATSVLPRPVAAAGPV